MPADLSKAYWDKLSERSKELYALVRPQAKATYTVDVRLDGLEDFLAGQARDLESMGGGLELEPDFQRGHVWTDDQRKRYVESLLRGSAPVLIRFNVAGWSGRGNKGDLPEHTMQCIDGLQRLTAVRSFLAGDIRIFGGEIGVEDLNGTPFSVGRYTLQVAVHEFANRADLLQFYLDLNAGGTVHTASELDRVAGLLASCRSGDLSGSGREASE